MIEIRALHEVPEFQEVVRLQKTIWGFDDVDVLPVRLFIVASKIGGQIFGAFDGERMIGFCVSLPGTKPGGGHFLHSNMLGVEAGYRDLGVGRLLKLAQRDEALSRDIGLIEWTFDPLEIKNAYFNMQRLGAVVRRYVLNQYGITSSGLHGGLPTDRCVAEWHLASERVQAMLAGRPLPPPRTEETIDIPDDIAELKVEYPRLAREIQEEVSKRFVELLQRGLAVIGVRRRLSSGGTYLLGRWEP